MVYYALVAPEDNLFIYFIGCPDTYVSAVCVVNYVVSMSTSKTQTDANPNKKKCRTKLDDRVHARRESSDFPFFDGLESSDLMGKGACPNLAIGA
jgi:hypothetical protein